VLRYFKCLCCQNPVIVLGFVSEVSDRFPQHKWGKPEPVNFVTVLSTNTYMNIPLLDSWEQLDTKTSENIIDAERTADLKAYSEAIKHS
jgi:CRISPR/Cas system CMR subunit Cmr6 (Cas7 group RAMP superfamily)